MDANATQPDELAHAARAVRRLARELVRDEARADDLAQDAWLAALRAGGRIRGPLGPWLFGAVRRIRRRDGRSEARRDARERRAARVELQPPADELLARAELGERLLAMVRELPETYRETLLLRYLEELEPEEIARRQGISASTVRTRVQRGLALLRARLGEREGGLAALVPLLRGLAGPEPAVALAVMTKSAKLWLGFAALSLAALGLRGSLSTPSDASDELALAPELELPAVSIGDEAELPVAAARAPLETETEVLAAPAREHFAIEGVVRDEQGAPIPDATVTAEDELGASLTDIAGDHGEYGFRELGPGRWTLRASAPERVAYERPWLLRGAPRVERLDLVLGVEPRLAVFVRTSTGEAYLDAAGHAERGVHAIATPEPPPPFLPSLHWGRLALGYWQRDAGPEGRLGKFKVDVQTDFFVSLVYGQAVLATEPVALGAAAVSFVLDPQRVEDASASVTMRFLDASGAPATRVLPRLGLGGGSIGGGFPDADGRLSFEGRAPGAYRLRLMVGGTLSREFRLGPGEALDLGDLVVGGGAHLHVHLEAPGASGQRALVSWGRSEVDRSTHEPVTDGVAVLTGLESGRYVVGVNKKGRSTDLRARLAWVDVTQEETAEVTLRLDPVGWLILQPDGAATLGTRYRVRDEGTGLVNHSGQIFHAQPKRLQVAQGSWLLEFETPAGERVEQPVFVGAEPETVRLPR